MKLVANLRQLMQCVRGVTAVEYALIAAGISAVIISVVFLFGDELVVTLGLLTESMQTASAGIDSD